MSKLNLPTNGSLSDISDYYTLLYGTFNKTIVGNLRFPTSGTSRDGYVYDTTGTIYANQGQVGMLSLLTFGDSLNPLYSNPKLEDYMITATEFNDMNTAIGTKADTTYVDSEINTIPIAGSILYAYNNLGGAF